MSRESAYRIVQKNAHSAWNNDYGNFRKNIEEDLEINKLATRDELDKCFDPRIHLKNLNIIWERLSI